MRLSGADPGTIAAAIERDAQILAGRPDDMSRRAQLYRELYRASGNNFIFPLIAAHGALWGRWYLFVGRLVARLFNLLDWSARPSGARVASFDRFVDAIKIIHRDVFAECYVGFHLTRTLGRHAVVKTRLSADVIELLASMHAATSRRESLSIAEQRRMYESFFRHEQERIAAPAVERAFAELQWPHMNRICRRPWVWLAYFRYGKSLNFNDFTVADERIEKGLISFDRAAALGWPTIESLLIKNPLYPGSARLWAYCARLLFKGTPWSVLNQRVREQHDSVG